VGNSPTGRPGEAYYLTGPIQGGLDGAYCLITTVCGEFNFREAWIGLLPDNHSMWGTHLQGGLERPTT